ncbi:MAG: hypothetical protein IPM54_27795 [Polyangiaceae bacterium]|nr:hypothetical protein [Polyangiaceae bacterium]
MPADHTPQAVLAELAGHPRGDELARLVHAVAFTCADERKITLPEGVQDAAAQLSLSTKDADTSFGNVITALEPGSPTRARPETRALLSALLARGVALSLPDGADAERRVVDALVWVAAHTSIDALASIDTALGAKADGLWRQTAALIRRIEAGDASIGRAGALVAAAALASSNSPVAHEEAKSLGTETRDPVIGALLANAARSGEGASASGEMIAAPRGPVALVLMAITGLLVIVPLARMAGRLFLRYRSPAELRVSPTSLTVIAKTELLGRTVREREIVVPLDQLSSVARDVRYPRLALYAGLFALALGSYVGVSLFVDGARAGSPDLLGMGALIVAVGVALDFALTNLMPVGRGRCRVLITPSKGGALAIGDVDPKLADAALQRLVPSS